MAAAAPAKTRRPRGTPRGLLIEAARELFARQDYRTVTTREIATSAGVTEHLLFRHFGTKAALFKQAAVVPFLEIVEGLNSRWDTLQPGPTNSVMVARKFLGGVYDLFVENRGLLVTLWSADSLTEEELRDTGIAEIDGAMAVLGRLGDEGSEMLGIHTDQQDLAARSTVAMVAGMAAFGTTFFAGTPPPRDVIVDELVQASLHGFLHRSV